MSSSEANTDLIQNDKKMKHSSNNNNNTVKLSPGQLGREGILVALEQGDIVCEPLDPKNISGAQIDVRLGFTDCYMLDEEFPRGGRLRCVNPWRKTPSTERLCTRQSALKASDLPPGQRTMYGLKKDDSYFILLPGAMGLFATHESVGAGPNFTTHMYSRSTTVRNGLSVCRCGGMGDPGYINRWTMEIKNELRHAPVVLVCGERIAQITFTKLAQLDGLSETAHAEARGASEEERAALDYRLRGGKYQLKEGATWKCEDMLPRGYMDASTIPAGVDATTDPTTNIE